MEFNNKEGKFWYSSKQRSMIEKHGREFRNFARLDNGELVEYTEWKYTNNPSNWDDAIYLGEGTYSHSEQ